jgi:integrase
MTVAKKTLARIEEALAMGTWPGLKEELSRGTEQEITVERFTQIYLTDYCEAHNRDVGFKRRAVKPIVRIIGDVKLKGLRRSHAHEFIAARSKEVSPASVNRNVAVLKNMLTFALEREYIETHPLLRFRMLPEEKRALRVLSLEEERCLVESIASCDPVIGAYATVLGETGLRKSEGLNLQWKHIDSRRRLLTVERTKSGKPRYIPLSDYALGSLHSLVRVLGCPHVFVNVENRKPWKDPRGPFFKGREKAGLEWVSFHDLRHFRATQWVMRGVDLRTVQELLGHSTITTTMQYAHYAPTHANRSLMEAQKAEVRELSEQEENRRKLV